jgi:hypothetical protein
MLGMRPSFNPQPVLFGLALQTVPGITKSHPEPQQETVGSRRKEPDFTSAATLAFDRSQHDVNIQKRKPERSTPHPWRLRK